MTVVGLIHRKEYASFCSCRDKNLYNLTNFQILVLLDLNFQILIFTIVPISER